ncbi:MAG: hypothetical protein ACI8UZ_002529, partial [Akkermansiaceae bacterium]
NQTSAPFLSFSPPQPRKSFILKLSICPPRPPDDFIQKTPHFLQDDSLFIMYLSS